MMTQALVFLSLVGLSYQAGLGDTLGSLPGNLGGLVNFTEKFKNFKQKHGRVYKNSAEEQFRFTVFIQNLQNVLQFQKEGGRGTAAFGVTKFADWTKEEKAQLNGIKLTEGNFPVSGNLLPPFPTRSKRQAANFDWVSQGKVTPIKDQGECGSCWAFAATALVESAVAISTGKFVNISEQELVSCDNTSNGCQGGDPKHAIIYSRTIGISSNADYPYTATNGNCTPSNTSKTFSTDWWYVANNETTMPSVLEQQGPLLFIMYVPDSMFYLTSSSDVYQPTAAECQNSTYLHATTIVGYGVSNVSGLPYWLIKNSWGTEWGNDGYFKLYRGAQSCFYTHPVYPSALSVSANASLAWTCANLQDEAMYCKYWQYLGYCDPSSQYYSGITGQCPAACGLCRAGSANQ